MVVVIIENTDYWWNVSLCYNARVQLVRIPSIKHVR